MLTAATASLYLSEDTDASVLSWIPTCAALYGQSHDRFL